MVSRMSQVRYPMKMVSQRTGLSAHVLRVWERRYEAVTPDRTGSNRRLYSEEEVRRLELMANLTRGGHSIGQIAQQSTEVLEEMAKELPPSSGETDQPISDESPSVSSYLEQAWKAVRHLDGAALERVLDQVTQEIGGSAMIEKVIVPLVVDMEVRAADRCEYHPHDRAIGRSYPRIVYGFVLDSLFSVKSQRLHVVPFSRFPLIMNERSSFNN